MLISIRSKLRSYAPIILPILDKIEKYFWWIGLFSITAVTVWVAVVQRSIFVTVMAIILITPILLATYIKSRNVLIVSVFILFALPISLTTYLLVFVNWLFPHIFSNQFFTYYFLFSIPIMSIATFLVYIRKESSLEKVKVSLEYNNTLYVVILFILFFVSNLTSDLTRLLPTVSPENLQGKSLADLKELVSLFFQIASGPFLIGNAILKSFVEHIAYRRGIRTSEDNGIT